MSVWNVNTDISCPPSSLLDLLMTSTLLSIFASSYFSSLLVFVFVFILYGKPLFEKGFTYLYLYAYLFCLWLPRYSQYFLHFQSIVLLHSTYQWSQTFWGQCLEIASLGLVPCWTIDGGTLCCNFSQWWCGSVHHLFIAVRCRSSAFLTSPPFWVISCHHSSLHLPNPLFPA